MAAPAIDSVTSTTSPGVATTTFAHTCAGSDRALYVRVMERFDSGITVTYDGVPLTLVASQANGTALKTWYWRLLNPPAGTFDVVVTMTGTARRIVVDAISLTGVDQTTPEGTAVGATGTSTSPSVGVASDADGLVLCAVSAQDDTTSTTATVSGGQTNDTNLATTNSTSNGVRGAAGHKAGAASVTCGWTLSSSVLWAALAIPVRGIVAAASSPKNMTTLGC